MDHSDLNKCSFYCCCNQHLGARLRFGGLGGGNSLPQRNRAWAKYMLRGLCLFMCLLCLFVSEMDAVILTTFTALRMDSLSAFFSSSSLHVLTNFCSTNGTSTTQPASATASQEGNSLILQKKTNRNDRKSYVSGQKVCSEAGGYQPARPNKTETAN